MPLVLAMIQPPMAAALMAAPTRLTSRPARL
jgi:hypothetical protein